MQFKIHYLKKQQRSRSNHSNNNDIQSKLKRSTISTPNSSNHTKGQQAHKSQLQPQLFTPEQSYTPPTLTTHPPTTPPHTKKSSEATKTKLLSQQRTKTQFLSERSYTSRALTTDPAAAALDAERATKEQQSQQQQQQKSSRRWKEWDRSEAVSDRFELRRRRGVGLVGWARGRRKEEGGRIAGARGRRRQHLRGTGPAAGRKKREAGRKEAEARGLADSWPVSGSALDRQVRELSLGTAIAVALCEAIGAGEIDPSDEVLPCISLACLPVKRRRRNSPREASMRRSLWQKGKGRRSGSKERNLKGPLGGSCDVSENISKSLAAR
ncbi:hypothetical protein KM043_008214 [Ampulex compressa]|nr:hypothetical protein KM043_008214 [Ampulex compressa]